MDPRKFENVRLDIAQARSRGQPAPFRGRFRKNFFKPETDTKSTARLTSPCWRTSLWSKLAAAGYRSTKNDPGHRLHV